MANFSKGVGSGTEELLRRLQRLGDFRPEGFARLCESEGCARNRLHCGDEQNGSELPQP